MFDNNSNIGCFEYGIDLDKPISYFCKLLFDIGNAVEGEFAIERLFKNEFIESIGVKFEYLNEDEKVPVLVREVAAFYIKEILSGLDKIESSNVLFVYKPNNFLFWSDDGKDSAQKVNASLTSLIISYKLYEKLIDKIENEKLKKIFGSISSLRYDEFYKNCVQVTPKYDSQVPYLPLSFFKEDLISENLIESDDVWINKKRIKKLFNLETAGITSPPGILASAENTEQEIGLKYGEFVFPFNFQDLKSLIKDEHVFEYYWFLFSFVFTKESNRGGVINDPLLTAFKADTKAAELTNTLSYLVNNHYLTDKSYIFKADFEKYFEEVGKIKGLKYVAGYDFFISNSEGKTSLGIYSDVKPDKDSKTNNLLHWVTNPDKTEYQHYRNEIKIDTLKNEPVFTLKPQIAFYFISKFFEDFLSEAIEELGLAVIKNFELFINGKTSGELDFLIKSDKKLIFIEAKTKLTNENIEKYVEKFGKLDAHLKKLDFESEFYIISAFSDDTLERKRYFIDQSMTEGYNVERKPLKTIPYYFNVPIPASSGKNLVCIAEPQFDKLKAILKNICQI
ncbi:hypothetical protein [Pedobacter sp. GR22-10]|uniref:hypothetical protein n=1 Tax=Pedobacter sp. GR22-10 TaxID=2994472 RepID=UPI00224816FF|nr:hypothetical protein [Pedobacter sp. GR22-10]MCX2429888.1 hypothetical protein [Pedobacter sp. GR22-10]